MPRRNRSVSVRASGRSAKSGHTSGPKARDPRPCCAGSKYGVVTAIVLMILVTVLVVEGLAMWMCRVFR